MATAGMITSLKLSPKQVVRALEHLAPDISCLLVGLHGIGKSQIALGLRDSLRAKEPEFNWPVIDKRLAQMTEGDLTGIPDAATIAQGHSAGKAVTTFLPTDWWQQACDEPCIVILEELNRAEVQLMNGGFQIVGSRELNGKKLHPKTRIIACVNPPTHYQVNEMDKALIDRFLVLHMKHNAADWLEWARGRLDDAIVDFIQEDPGWLHHDPSKTQDLEVAPTPRSWEKLDMQLKHAQMRPSNFMGQSVPDLITWYAFGLVGMGAGTAFLKWLRSREMHLTVEDILDNWHNSDIQRLKRRLRHEEILSVVARLGEHSKEHKWTQSQANNVIAFGLTLPGEDQLALFSAVTRSGQLPNILKVHNSKLTDAVVDRSNESQDLSEKRAAL